MALELQTNLNKTKKTLTELRRQQVLKSLSKDSKSNNNVINNNNNRKVSHSIKPSLKSPIQTMHPKQESNIRKRPSSAPCYRNTMATEPTVDPLTIITSSPKSDMKIRHTLSNHNNNNNNNNNNGNTMSSYSQLSAELEHTKEKCSKLEKEAVEIRKKLARNRAYPLLSQSSGIKDSKNIQRQPSRDPSSPTRGMYRRIDLKRMLSGDGDATTIEGDFDEDDVSLSRIPLDNSEISENGDDNKAVKTNSPLKRVESFRSRLIGCDAVIDKEFKLPPHMAAIRNSRSFSINVFE